MTHNPVLFEISDILGERILQEYISFKENNVVPFDSWTVGIDDQTVSQQIQVVIRKVVVEVIGRSHCIGAHSQQCPETDQFVCEIFNLEL